MSKSRPRRRSGAGRPRKALAAADGAARRRLLDAAARRFAESGYAATSLRAVAQEAGVTPGMVAYYFDDKWGLLEAVLLEGLELLLGALQEAIEPPADAAAQTGTGAVDPTPLGRFVAAYLGAVTAHPWIPRIIVQEVISRDSSLRELFLNRFANRALALAGPMLAAEVRAGRLRADLDTRLTLMSVVGMCEFPYLAEPLLGPLLDYRIDDTFAAAFIPHTVTLLERGVGARS